MTNDSPRMLLPSLTAIAALFLAGCAGVSPNVSDSRSGESQDLGHAAAGSEKARSYDIYKLGSFIAGKLITDKDQRVLGTITFDFINNMILWSDRTIVFLTDEGTICRFLDQASKQKIIINRDVDRDGETASVSVEWKGGLGVGMNIILGVT